MSREEFFKKIVGLVFACFIKPITDLFRDEEVLDLHEEQGPEIHDFRFTITYPYGLDGNCNEIKFMEKVDIGNFYIMTEKKVD